MDMEEEFYLQEQGYTLESNEYISRRDYIIQENMKSRGKRRNLG